MHLHARVPGACQQARTSRRHNLTGTHHDVAGMGFFGSRANVLPHLSRRREADVRALVAIAVEHVDDLVLHHGIGALWHRRARHNADRLARADRTLKHMTRRLVANNGKRHRSIAGGRTKVDGAHGITVHGAVGKWRDVDIGHGFLGQGKAGRLPYGNLDNPGRTHM